MLRFAPAAVPEPASWGLMLGGLGWLLARRKRVHAAH